MGFFRRSDGAGRRHNRRIKYKLKGGRPTHRQWRTPQTPKLGPNQRVPGPVACLGSANFGDFFLRPTGNQINKHSRKKGDFFVCFGSNYALSLSLASKQRLSAMLLNRVCSINTHTCRVAPSACSHAIRFMYRKWSGGDTLFVFTERI